MKVLRELVSRDKLRFREEGFDLDLTYITNQIIAMGIPGEKASRLWRNDIDEVARFLKTKHAQHFLIINLSGLTYDYMKFGGRVKEFGFPDHHTPRIDYLWKICVCMDDFIKQDPTNVCAVHCLAGRGRTGTIIAAYLIYNGTFNSAKESLDYFGYTRSTVGEGVVGPSQMRYVEYFARIKRGEVQLPLQAPKKYYKLLKIVMGPIPSIESGGIRAVVKIFELPEPEKQLYSSYSSQSSTQPPPKLISHTEATSLTIDVNQLFYGDIQLKLFHRAKSKRKWAEALSADGVSKMEAFSAISTYPYFLLCRYTFHTNFLPFHFQQNPPMTVLLRKSDLDAVFAGPLVSQFFDEAFYLRLYFEESTELCFSPPELAPAPSFSAASPVTGYQFPTSVSLPTTSLSPSPSSPPPPVNNNSAGKTKGSYLFQHQPSTTAPPPASSSTYNPPQLYTYPTPTQDSYTLLPQTQHQYSYPALDQSGGDFLSAAFSMIPSQPAYCVDPYRSSYYYDAPSILPSCSTQSDWERFFMEIPEIPNDIEHPASSSKMTLNSPASMPSNFVAYPPASSPQAVEMSYYSYYPTDQQFQAQQSPSTQKPQQTQGQTQTQQSVHHSPGHSFSVPHNIQHTPPNAYGLHSFHVVGGSPLVSPLDSATTHPHPQRSSYPTPNNHSSYPTPSAVPVPIPTLAPQPTQTQMSAGGVPGNRGRRLSGNVFDMQRVQEAILAEQAEPQWQQLGSISSSLSPGTSTPSPSSGNSSPVNSPAPNRPGSGGAPPQTVIHAPTPKTATNTTSSGGGGGGAFGTPSFHPPISKPPQRSPSPSLSGSGGTYNYSQHLAHLAQSQNQPSVVVPATRERAKTFQASTLVVYTSHGDVSTTETKPVRATEHPPWNYNQ